MAGVRASKRKTKVRVTKAPAKRKTAKRKAASKRKTAKRKTTVKRKTSPKRKAPKRKTAKRKTAKRKPPKRKTAKRKTPKRKSAKRKTAKRKSAPKRAGTAIKKVVRAAKRKSNSKRKKSQAEILLLSELESLAKYIHSAKAEIAEIRPDEVKDEYLPRATTELDAIVQATADATNAIMDACDDIEAASNKVDGEVSTALVGSTTKIYEACTFQDITGQRIGKVVNTLQHIEARIDMLVEVFDIQSNNTKAAKEQPTDQGELGANDGDLLEGPQLEGQGRSQAEIDDLLASFD